MKKIDLGQTITILANIGVIGGLIFVGMQLRQDREIATIDRRNAYSDSIKLWAELVTVNWALWEKGMAGELLTPSETVQFDVLAGVRNYDLWRNWANSGISAYEPSPDIDRSTLRQSFIRQAALEFYSHPGLLDWYEKNEERLKQIGRYGEFERLIDEEIDRLRNGSESN